jgi:arginase
MTTRAVHIIGVPLDLGAGHRGVDMGPSALRIAGLHHGLVGLGCQVLEKGDVPAPVPETRDAGDPRKKYVREITAVCETLYQWALASHGSVAAAAAFARADGRPIGLLWVDAHADMNTPQSSASGNVHGMPLAALLGDEPAELAGIGGFTPKVAPERTVLVGIRNLDARERERVSASGVHVFTMKDIDRLGIAAVTERALALAGADAAGVHVSFDLDACDPAIAPGVGTPVKGGLDYREAHMLMETVADSGRLMSLDMVEVNPILDVRNETAALGVELVLSALGLRIL